MTPNPNKRLEIAVGAERWQRLPIRTHVITARDQLPNIMERYVRPHLQPDDHVFIAERVVAIAQGRAFPIKDINPSWLARLLVRFVHKSPYGIGLGSPWTMELAVREAGAARIILAALAALSTKPFGIRGVFYKIAGPTVAAIDGPCDYTLPPYNKYAKLGPKEPDRVAIALSAAVGAPVVIIDANDLGVAVLGKSGGITDQFAKAVFRDNPLGQSDEQTPIAIVRKSK
ncbi:F420-0--gamma-glutamyl ligase [Candidatus Parcubacteria bacterium]|nr:F420-0--gamma-glutamyl ligase [Candidatus Parcubacteria bacterium]